MAPWGKASPPWPVASGHPAASYSSLSLWPLYPNTCPALGTEDGSPLTVPSDLQSTRRSPGCSACLLHPLPWRARHMSHSTHVSRGWDQPIPVAMAPCSSSFPQTEHDPGCYPMQSPSTSSERSLCHSIEEETKAQGQPRVSTPGGRAGLVPIPGGKAGLVPRCVSPRLQEVLLLTKPECRPWATSSSPHWMGQKQPDTTL